MKSNPFDTTRSAPPNSFEDTLRNTFMGEEVYIEGARMNYVGKLVGVQASSDGTMLWLDPLVRVGDWNRLGPEPPFCMRMGDKGPCAIPLMAVEQFGRAPAGWLKRGMSHE